jgi:hypothetical protein
MYVYITADRSNLNITNLNIRQFTQQPSLQGSSTEDGWYILNAGTEPTLTETQYMETTIVTNDATNTATLEYAVSTKTTEMVLIEEYMVKPNVSVSKIQFRLALFDAGVLDAVEAAVSGVNKIYYQESQFFNSHDSRLISTAISLNLSATVVASIFQTAITK